MTKVRKPRLLDGKMREAARLEIESQSIDMTIKPLSTASIMMQDASGVGMREYIELYTHKGSAGVYRVSGKETGYGEGSDRIDMEHGLCVLGDAIMPGEFVVKEKVKKALETALEYQTTKINGVNAWTVGVVEVDKNEEIEIGVAGTNVLEFVLQVMAELPDYRLDYDMSTIPWVMHVVKNQTEPSCEGRLGRNVASVRVTYDDTELCTRVYCPRFSSGYMQIEPKPKYGIVSQNIPAAEDIPIEKVEKAIRRYLRERAEPMITVEIDAVELCEITGERLDRFNLGDLMRLALPDYGTVVNERIVSIRYESVYASPEKVRISLANTPRDVAINLSSLVGATNKMATGSVRGGGGGGQSLAMSSRNLTSLMDQADDIEEINGKMTHWFNVVGVDLDAEDDELKIFATRTELDATEERVSQVEITLNGDEEHIGLAAQVLENGEWITKAGIDIYGENGIVEIIGKLKADVADLQLLLGDSITVRTLNVTGTTTTDGLNVDGTASFLGSIRVDGYGMSVQEATFLTPSTSISVTSSGGTVTGVTLSRKTETIHFLGY